MHGSPAGALKQVIYARYHKQFVTMFLQVKQALVSVYHLFEIYRLINHMHERVLSIVLAIDAIQLLNINCVLYDYCSEYATGKVTTIRDEVDIGAEAALQMLD